MAAARRRRRRPGPRARSTTRLSCGTTRARRCRHRPTPATCSSRRSRSRASCCSRACIRPTTSAAVRVDGDHRRAGRRLPVRGARPRGCRQGGRPHARLPASLDLVLLGMLVGTLTRRRWARGPHVAAADRRRGAVLPRRLALHRRHRDRDRSRRATGSTPAGGRACSLIGLAAHQRTSAEAARATRSAEAVMMVAPMLTGAIGIGVLVRVLDVTAQRARRHARERGAGRRHAPARPHLPAELRRAAGLALRGAERRADRPRQPPRPRARAGPQTLADDGPARVGARPLRPQRLQDLQRHLRPPGRRRAARAPRLAPGRAPSRRRGAPSAWAATSSACCCASADARPRRRARAACARCSSSAPRASTSPPPPASSGSPSPVCAPRPTSLRIADQRMYAEKAGGRLSAPRQSAEVLKRALAEHGGAIAPEAEDAGPLAAAIARRLGLPPDRGPGRAPRHRAARRRADRGTGRRSSPCPARSPRSSGRSCAATRWSASGSSPPRPRCGPSRGWSAPATSTTTAAATRTA